MIIRDFVPTTTADAEAPTVTIDAIANHNEGSTVTLGATLTGGTYDTVNYLWSIDSGGGSIDDPTAVTPVYTDPDVSFNTSVTLRLTITANGTGTNAADGTSDAASDTEQFAVFFVADIPDAVAHAVNAGDSAFAFAVPEPTVTHTPATVAALVLSDFVLADGLEAEVLGLIEAAEPIDVFSRSPRPARGTLVDGELDLSGDSEPVTRFRFRAQATNTAGGARITLNDSGTLSLADFFGSGGGGADLTVWVQTSAGVISFASLGAIADSTQSGDHFVTWGVPTNDQLLVAGITDGDLFIFALTRPEPESEDHAVDAGDAAFAFALPQPSVTHVPICCPGDNGSCRQCGRRSVCVRAPRTDRTHTSAPRQASLASPFP